MTPEIPPDAVQDRSLCSLPPLERRCLVGVFVEVIVSPSQFYVHVCSRETSDKLQDMMVDMRCEHAILIQYYYLCVCVCTQGTWHPHVGLWSLLA